VRALHVYSGNLYGGIETMLATIARSATLEPAASHEFALCFDGRLAGELREAGAAVHLLGDVRVSRPATIVRGRRALQGVLNSVRPDCAVVHAPWTHALFAGVIRNASVPLVFWAHDVMTGRHWTERLAARTPPDRVICNSQFTRTTQTRLFDSHIPGTVVYPPVEHLRTPAACRHRADIRAAEHTDEGAIVIATACRSEPWKGHELLLDELKHLRDVPRWVWWQIGGAQRLTERGYLGALARRAEAHGIADRVRWLGERSDVPQLLQAADLYCQPNAAPEPFGIAFVEALAAGLPVVTTGFGAAPEIVDATCGVLITPGDAAGLAAALKRLITQDEVRRRLGGDAPARAAALCDPGQQMARLRSAIEIHP
jgi:glycosyltransferase involved in cell wall biosynthesis